MIRRLLAAALCVAVQAMLIERPAMHAHLDDHATSHHASRTLHSHFEPHHVTAPGEHAALENADHDVAVSLSAIAAVASPAFSSPALTVGTFEVAVPARHSIGVTFEVTHGHDPPWFASRSSRAPPSLLS